ncbi:DNA ligase 1-like [Archocentrus centrarchus]|uniref:DNA ligase 1-like n=1 Tax=Archocentrus centrarchus TaxID=63155 RepID=UPI0011E9CC87|nr:DNA ligase 1-like [Archocentrus centrarchus]
MSDAQRPQKRNMLESQKKAEDFNGERRGDAGYMAYKSEEWCRYYPSEYKKATKVHINCLKMKLEASENKLKELQKCYFSTNNSGNIDNLITQLAESEKKVNELEANKTILENTINDLKEKHHTLAMDSYNYKTDSEITINNLKKQLAEACLPQNLQEQSSQPAAELSAEPSCRATKASQTDFKSAKMADLELKCGKQQAQNQQLQQQLQESQRQLEEQAIQHRQEREKFQSEMNEVKSLLANYKDLHAFYLKIMKEENEEKSSMGTRLEKAEAEKELLPQTVEPLQKKQGTEQGKEGKVDLEPAKEKHGNSTGKKGKVDLVLQTSLSLQEPAEEKQGMEQGKEGKVDLVPQTSLSLQEPAKEKQGTEQEKAGKGDSLLETVRSLQESLKTKQGNEKILIAKLEKLEEQPKQKKKKRNWLLRLFNRNKS